MLASVLADKFRYGNRHQEGSIGNLHKSKCSGQVFHLEDLIEDTIASRQS